MTEPLNFFYFLVYKLPVSVLISRGQNFRLPENPALAVAGNASAKVHRGAMTMNLFGARQKQLLSFLTANAERETLDYVLQGMRKILGDDMHEPGFPVLRIGNRMVVPKEQFIQWVKEHTGGGT